ncbi:la-related protein 7 [Culicoides brevitarsis]|uniref:la-related protein 7 n=1 Tax=Culicoides brevitarsis TaxID=469753 RepID=UPI00307C9209
MEKTEKKYRQRNKQRRNAIRQQLEFYFSDSNLTKDRYLNQLVKNSPDGYVEISEFLKFNKIKALTQTVEDIAKAVSGSELLALSEDSTKVKRKTELQVKADADECTLYVESLPKSATHDYVKEIFSKYGNVVYVSLPRFKHSRRIKEFGFVEFENQEGLKKAVEAFKQWNGVLMYEDADPDKLQSVISFNEEQKESKEGEKDENNQSKGTEDETEEPPMKKLRTESESTENQENEANLNASEEVKTAENAEKDKEPEKSEKTDKKKKKSKSSTGTTVTEDKVFDIKVMPKREWKRLRNKYLNLQRTRFKEIKQKLQAGRKQQEKKQQKKKTPIPSKASHASPRKINFYGALPFDTKKSGGEENEMMEVQSIPPKKPLFSFEPGLIVNIKFQEPLVDVKEFKQELKALTFVKYIDVKEGQSEAFVRVDKFASANQLVKFYTNSEYQTQILSGEVEQRYWQKMMSDREQKLNKTVKVKQVRGREKLSKKIAQHIRFDN